MSIVAHGEAARESGGGPFHYPQLTATNYTSWVIRVQAMMEDQGVWEAIEPAVGAAVDTKKDKKARSHLLQALPEDLLMQVARKKTMPFEEAVGRLKTYEERTRPRTSGGNSSGDGQLLLTQAEWQARQKKDGGDSSSNNKGKSYAPADSSNRSRSGRGRGRWHGKGSRGGTPSKDGASGSSGGGRDKSHIRCFNCDKMGHYASECRAPKKKEEAHLTRADDTEPALMLAVSEEIEQNIESGRMSSC